MLLLLLMVVLIVIVHLAPEWMHSPPPPQCNPSLPSETMQGGRLISLCNACGKFPCKCKLPALDRLPCLGSGCYSYPCECPTVRPSPGPAHPDCRRCSTSPCACGPTSAPAQNLALLAELPCQQAPVLHRPPRTEAPAPTRPPQPRIALVRLTSTLWLAASRELQRCADLASEAQENENDIDRSLTVARQTSAKRQREHNDAHLHLATATAAYDKAMLELRRCRSSAQENENDVARALTIARQTS